jgi:hypothetical protein
MSGRLDTEAELRKLAHQLAVPTEELDLLQGVPAGELRELRAQISEAMFRHGRHAFARVAALSKAVPTSVSAKLTEAVLPPLIAARVSELLEPAKAAEMVTKISDRYLADVSAVMDPARTPDVIAAIPSDRVATISIELARRGEWVVIGGFASHIGGDGLTASVATYNGEQLLRIGFVLEDAAKMNDIVGLLTDKQVDGMITAAADKSLWTEVGDMLEHLSDERAERVATRFAVAPEQVRASFEAAVASGELETAAYGRLAGR